MGLFQQKQPSKKPSDDEISDNEQHFFDEYFREELRNHGRWYFEKVIAENGKLFKQELDATVQRVDGELKEYLTKQVNTMVEQIGTDLREHVTTKITEQVAEHSTVMKEAQDKALEESITT
jgi:gas vesicle protein